MNADIAYQEGYARAEEIMIEKLKPVLMAAVLALRSYQYGNTATDLAREVADKIDQVLEEDLPRPPDYANKART